MKGGINKMELGNQIRKYRKKHSLSQEALAEKLYVTRQTISNWENDKSYPDVKSLLLLSEVLEISVDNLIKGDVVIMKERVEVKHQKEFDRAAKIYGIMLFMTIISMIPLIRVLKEVGLVIWIAIMLATMYTAIVVEKKKKKYDIQTYKEIIAFLEGTKLDEIEKMKEDSKSSYQKILFGILSAILVLIVFSLLDIFF